jgi:hypothetical protein
MSVEGRKPNHSLTRSPITGLFAILKHENFNPTISAMLLCSVGAGSKEGFNYH